MKKLFKRSSSKKLKSSLDGSFANLSVDGSPGRSRSQLSNYSGDSNYSSSNLSIDSLGPGKGYILAKKQKLPPSCKAAWKGEVKKLKKALKKSNVNEQDKDLRTPLHYASAQGHTDVITHLISTGYVDPNIRDNEGKTALIKACECNQLGTAQILLESQYTQPLDFNFPDSEGNSPLLIAVTNDNTELASHLVMQGADVNRRNTKGDSPVSAAVKRENLELVELLGSESADLTGPDRDGRTPLMNAVKLNHVSIVKYLLSLFPCTTAKDVHGWTALDFAQVCPDNTCLRLLEEHDKRCGNPDYNPEQDNITTINSQDEALNHKNSANDWTAPPDGDLTEDDTSFMSSPMELNGACSPEIIIRKPSEDIDIDIEIDAELSSDKSVSEVDLSIQSNDKIEVNSAPGAAVNKLLDTLNKSSGEKDFSEGQVEYLTNFSPSQSPGTDEGSLGQISNIHEDDSSINLSSEDLGYIPSAPMPDFQQLEYNERDEANDLKLKLGFSMDDDVSCTTQSGPPSPSQSKQNSPKRLPPTPRKDSSEGSTPRASPRTTGYLLDDEESTLSSITEKTEPNQSPAFGEMPSPEPISPLPADTLSRSGSISMNSDVEISGYMTESLRSAESGRKSVSPKGDTPSDFRVTPALENLNSDSVSSHSARPVAIASGVTSLRRTPPATPPSTRSSIADGVVSGRVHDSPMSQGKLHYGSMFGGDSTGESDDSSTNDFIESLNRSSPVKSDKTKSVDINDLSIVSKSKSSLDDHRNILNSARSSPTPKKSSDTPLKSASISEDFGIETETDDEAEVLLAESGELLRTYSAPLKQESSMTVDVKVDEVRVPAALAPDSKLHVLDQSFDDNYMKPKLARVQQKSEDCEADLTVEDSSSDESETGKLAKKYLSGKKSREGQPTPSSSNYCSSVSPMSGEVLEQKSLPTSKQITPRVSFSNAPILFAEPDRTSTPIKPDKSKQEEESSSSQAHGSGMPESVFTAKYEDIERRKSEAEKELHEIRQSRRSQSPVSLSESVITDSRNVKTDPQASESNASLDCLDVKEEIPVDVETAIRKDLQQNPDTPPAVRAEANMTECAAALNEAVSYIQQNLDTQSNPLIGQLQEQVKETKQRLHRVTESKNKSETLRKQLEIETEELRRKIDNLTRSRTGDEKSKIDMELELRGLKFKFDHEVEQRENLESLYKTAKENLRVLESKQKTLTADYSNSESTKKHTLLEVEKAEKSQRHLEHEVEELKRRLEEEQKTRLIQEEMFNDQVNRSRDLNTEAQKNIRQKQDVLHQLTEAEEVCRNAENRNKALLSDVTTWKSKYETKQNKWNESESEMKSSVQKLEASIAELQGTISRHNTAIASRDEKIGELEEKVRSEISALTLTKHGFELKENELSTSNKQFSDELTRLKVELERAATERDISKKQLVEMEGKLQQAEEIGTTSANEQINKLNQRIGELDAQLSFKTQDQEETGRKLRDAGETIRTLQSSVNQEKNLMRMREESLSTDADHLQETLSGREGRIRELEVLIGELEEKLLHSQSRTKDVQGELDETNKLILNKTGALLSTAEREQIKDKYVESLEEQVNKEREKFSRTNHELELLKCKFDHLSEDNKSLQMQLEQAGESLQMRDESVNQVSDKLHETRAKLVKENDKSREELKRKNEALQEHISELRQSLVSAEAAKDMAEIEISRLKQEVKQQASSLRVKEDMYKQQKSNLETRNGELSEETRKTEKKLQDLYTERLNLKNDLSNTRDKLDMEINTRKELERRMDGITLKNSTLGNEVIELKGNHERELQNKSHYMDLYKAEQEYTKQLKDELNELKKNVASLESLNETLRNTVEEFKDSHREEKMGRTLASKELDETRQMLENEIKTRSHIGSRITTLERENQEMSNALHNEQKRVKKAAQARKVADANVDALQDNLTDLHKDIAELKDQLLYTQKLAEEGKVKEQKYNALKGKVQRDKLAQRRRVEDMERTLGEAQNSARAESERRGEAEGSYLLLKNEMQGLQAKVAQLQSETGTSRKARQSAEVRAQQLQTELNNIHNRIGSDLVTRDELDSVKKQAEGKARIELNRKLEEINSTLDEQSKARTVIESMRAENEEKMRRGFERTAADLKRELDETRTALSKDQVNASTLATENRLMRGILEKEQDRRKQLEHELEDSHRDYKGTSRTPDLSPPDPNKNLNTPRKAYSDPSETLARMKARLNQSINKYLDEKINNDGSTELWAAPRSGAASEDMSPRTELQRSGRTSPSPRYMSIMKSNYYL